MRNWLDEICGPDRLADLDACLSEFLTLDNPVATLFGAYGTGKSSILRRLLVDSGRPIPEWLTVSARHETFAEQTAELDGCIVRDTPGLSPGGEDARSKKNSDVARSTLGRTDILLVTLNPQLPTGERDELREVLEQKWPESSVWFLISRADESGLRPQIDPDGFEKWSQAKRDELRDSLQLGAQTPIFVLIPDFGQLGGFAAEPTPSTWDGSRPWDGMDDLRKALDQLSSLDLATSRAAAEHRYWKIAVSDRLVVLRTELAELTTARDVVASSLHRRDLYLQQIDALTGAAETSLQGAIEDAVHRAVRSGSVDAESIASSVDPILREWWLEQQAAIARIRQDATRAIDMERDGRGWKVLNSFYDSFQMTDGSDRGSTVDRNGRSFTPKFAEFGKEAADARKDIVDLEKIKQKRLKPEETPKPQTESAWGGRADIAVALLPVAIELVGLVEDAVRGKQEKAREQARRREIEDEVARVVHAAAADAMRDLQPDIDALRSEIAMESADQHEVDALTAAVDEASMQIERAEALIVS